MEAAQIIPLKLNKFDDKPIITWYYFHPHILNIFVYRQMLHLGYSTVLDAS